MKAARITAHYLAIAFFVCAPISGLNDRAGLLALFATGLWYGNRIALLFPIGETEAERFARLEPVLFAGLRAPSVHLPSKGEGR